MKGAVRITMYGIASTSICGQVYCISKQCSCNPNPRSMMWPQLRSWICNNKTQVDYSVAVRQSRVTGRLPYVSKSKMSLAGSFQSTHRGVCTRSKVYGPSLCLPSEYRQPGNCSLSAFRLEVLRTENCKHTSPSVSSQHNTLVSH